MMYALQKMRREKLMVDGGFSVLWREGKFGVKFLSLNFAGILAFWRKNLVKFSENLRGFCDFMLFLGEFGRKFMAKIFALSRFAKNGKFVGFYANFSRIYANSSQICVNLQEFGSKFKLVDCRGVFSKRLAMTFCEFLPNLQWNFVDCFEFAYANSRNDGKKSVNFTQNYGVEREICVNSLKFSQKFAEFTRNYGKEREFMVGFFAPLRFAQNDKFMGFHANFDQIYANLQEFNSKFKLVDCFVSAVALPRTQRVAKQNDGKEREFPANSSQIYANSLKFSQKFAEFTRNDSKEKVAK